MRLDGRLENWLGLPRGQGRRLAHFLGLAMSIAVIHVFAYAIASSLFLSQVGASALPDFYVILGLVSIPISMGVSWVIDRVPRVWLFRLLLGLAVGITLSLRLLLLLRQQSIYYAVYTFLSLMELLSSILLWTLLTDYFTPLELKRYAVSIQMANTAGGLVGGALVTLLINWVSTENLLVAIPGLYGVVIGQLTLLCRQETALLIGKPDEDESDMFSTVRTMPRLLQRFPIICFLALGMLVATMLWQISEFQFLGIYASSFPDPDALAEFLGLFSAVLALLELLLTYGVTGPLLRHWGINRMNLVYPLTTLISFVAMALNFQLPGAMLLHINYDTLNNSVAQPVQNLNYNAIPHRFMGRVRVLLDGLVYPASQAIAGVVLTLQQHQLEPWQITLTGIGLSISFLGIGYLTGHSYLQSLLQRLQSGLVNLDEVSSSLAILPDRYINEVRLLLRSVVPDNQLLGLELAGRLDDPGQFLDEVQVLLLKADQDVRQGVVRLLSTGKHPEFHRYLRTQMISEHEVVRQAVLEALIRGQHPLSPVQLAYFLEDESPQVRALACVAVQISDTQDAWVLQLYQKVRLELKDSASRLAMIQVCTQDRSLIPLLVDLVKGSTIEVKRQGLKALARLAQPQDRHLANLSIIELRHPDAGVRAAALQLLAAVRQADRLAWAIMAMVDPEPIVRQQAAQTVAAHGETSLAFLERYLTDDRPEVIETAIAAIGLIRTRRAESMLLDYLQPYYAGMLPSLRWQQQLPSQTGRWQMLAIALADYHELVLEKVLYILSCLGQGQMLRGIRRMLKSHDLRQRANAVETLLSISQRRFIQPLLPLLEHLARSHQCSPPPLTPPVFLQEILEMVPRASLPVAVGMGSNLSQWPDRLAGAEKSSERWVSLARHRRPKDAVEIPFAELTTATLASRWLRIGALIALEQQAIPVELQDDPDPIVREVVSERLSFPDQLIHHHSPSLVSRILFLKNVALLQSLSLDDMLLVDRTLEQQEYLAGEVVFKENTAGRDFYVIYQGQINILKRGPQGLRSLAQLGPGQYFGEMALFDDGPRSATATAATDCTLLKLGKEDFHNLINQRPEIMLQMCRILSQRLREADQRVGQS